MKRTVAIFLIGALISSLPIISAQNADAQSNAFTFTTLGDYGANNTAADTVAGMVDTWNPDIIITLGDNYHEHAGGVGSEKYDLSTGQHYCSFLKDITTTGTACPTGQASVNRFFPVLGDHDYADAGTIDNLPSTYLDYFTLPGVGYTSSSNNERYYDFVSGPVHFFVLNGLEQPGFEPDGTDPSSMQAQWLRNQMAASTSIWNVVVVHKPPYSSGTKHGAADHMQWPFAQWGADVVFSGHEHFYERILRDGIVYFVNGLGGDWIYPFGTPIEGSAVRYNASNGAQRVTVTNTSMTIEFYSIENGGTLRDSYTITTPHRTATPTLPLIETGWQSPSGQAASGSNGDRNGYEVNATYAFANDGLAAMDLDSGTGPLLDCADSGKDKHRFFDYNFPVPDGSLVEGIQVRLDANADSTVGDPKLCVSLSWDDGTTWSPWKISPGLTDAENSYFLGGSSDIWGHTWTSTELSNANFQVRVANIASDNDRDFTLEWIAVNTTYSLGSTASTGTPTSTPTNTPTATPTHTPTSTQTGTSTATSTPTHASTSTPTATPVWYPSGADIDIRIGRLNQQSYTIKSGQSLRESFFGLDNGPVKVTSANTVPLLAAERVIYKVNGVGTSFSEMMALPNSQVDTVYWLPWYNSKTLDTQLRIANVSDMDAVIQVTIGDLEMDAFILTAGASTRKSFPNIDKGPVKIVSDQEILVSERVIYKVNGVGTSFTEMMALPASAVDTVYWLPWYNSKTLDTQLRIANVSNADANVHVTIGGMEVTGSPFTIPANTSIRKTFHNIDKGPVKIESDHGGASIVAAERVIYKVNGVDTSFTEMMAVPSGLLDTTYWLPWYNTKTLDTQLRIANVSGVDASVHVSIGGTEVTGSPFTIPANTSIRKSFTNIDRGPVKIVSDHDGSRIVAAERVIYTVNGMITSFSEMMGLPNGLLDTTYWLPWYNSKTLDTQLRFGMP